MSGRLGVCHVWKNFPILWRFISSTKVGFEGRFCFCRFEDQADDARAFLKTQGVDFPTYLKLSDDRAFINTLDPNWSGRNTRHMDIRR